ncbi:MAG TPA: MFS transporter, partial [Casimicrobiaceae bacterium]|nr:MFS transporter [Casimicrobiaceae bacterium]
CAFAPSFSALVIARMLAGATAGALIPLSVAWIGDAVPYARRQPVLARFLVGQMFGIALGQVLGGLGADYLGATVVFIVLGAWFAASAWLMWRVGPARTDVAASTASIGTIVARFASVLKVPWARVVLVSIFLDGVLLFGALAFIPTHLNRSYGLALTAAGAIVMLYGVGGLVFAASSHVLLRRLGEPGLAAVGAVLLVVCLATVALGHVIALAALACLVAGLGFYMLHNTLQVNATQMAPSQRGSSLGLFAACLFIGQSIGVTLAGQAAERFGTGPVIAGAGVLLLVLGLAFAAARHRHIPTAA